MQPFRAGRLEAVGGGGSFVGVGGNLIDAIYGVESSYLWLKSSYSSFLAIVGNIHRGSGKGHGSFCFLYWLACCLVAVKVTYPFIPGVAGCGFLPGRKLLSGVSCSWRRKESNVGRQLLPVLFGNKTSRTDERCFILTFSQKKEHVTLYKQ